MFKINISFHHCLLVFAAFFALDTFELTAAKDPLTRLQDSFGAPPAVRRKIYAEVIRLSGPAETDSIALLARAVALQQRAMDLEDEYIDRMIKTAPAFPESKEPIHPFSPITGAPQMSSPPCKCNFLSPNHMENAPDWWLGSAMTVRGCTRPRSHSGETTR